MRNISFLSFVALSLIAVGCHQDARVAGYTSFGASMETSSSMPLAEAIDRVDELAGKNVCIEAKIVEVCAKRGCWMMLEDGGTGVRVRFTKSETCTDGFLVPRNAAGHNAFVFGEIKREMMPEDLARHYAEDAGKSPEEIAKIVGEQPAIAMYASGVMISEGDKLDPPVQ